MNYFNKSDIIKTLYIKTKWFMWLFQSHTVLIELDSLTYKQWDEVKWRLHFDFWEEVIKADKISIALIRDESHSSISSNINVGQWWVSGGKSYWSTKRSTKVFSQDIAWSWEYTKESFPFHFVLPSNLVKKTASMDVLVSKIPEKYRETARSFLEIALSFFSKVPKKDFKLEARIDIPWAKDIVNKANVRIDY